MALVLGFYSSVANGTGQVFPECIVRGPSPAVVLTRPMMMMMVMMLSSYCQCLWNNVLGTFADI